MRGMYDADLQLGSLSMHQISWNRATEFACAKPYPALKQRVTFMNNAEKCL